MSTLKAPTLSDVAREAGVSPYTVSGVLNGARTNTRVSPATRDRILASAKRLRYQPNAQARNLARRCTQTLGVLFDYVRTSEVLTTDYSSAILQGIVSEAAACQYDILLYTDTSAPGDPQSMASLARFRDQRTDGIIVVAPLEGDAVMADLAASGLPLVAISAAPFQTMGNHIAFVDVDNGEGIDLAVSHLASLGHERIAHLTGNANMYSVGVRRDAFFAATNRHGLITDNALICECAYDGSLVDEAMDALFALPQPPTAIVAGNDSIALSVLEVARKKNLSVPDQLSVIGFDDVALAAHVSPKLTTLRQPLAEIGGAAVRLLIERISCQSASEPEGAAGASPTARLLYPELIVRDSTTAAPQGTVCISPFDPCETVMSGRGTPTPKGTQS